MILGKTNEKWWDEAQIIIEKEKVERVQVTKICKKKKEHRMYNFMSVNLKT
jgi:hypothetical protein